MARKISGKIVVEAKMVTITPLCVGGIGAGDAVDLELAVNGKGEYFIPGTGLMGALRSWFETDPKLNTLMNAMLGFQNGDNGAASYLFIEDAVLETDGFSREIRDGIGIDPRTGTTEDGKKYTRAVLPKGVCFPLILELDLPKDKVKVKEKDAAGKDVEVEFDAKQFTGALKWMLDRLKDEGLLLGASKTRGLGRTKAESIKAAWYKFPDDMAAWLAMSKEKVDYQGILKEGDDIVVPPASPRQYLNITINWSPLSPVMVKSGADGGIADMLPLVSGYKANTVVPVIPGSSIKGVLRARAEKILRTILEKELPGEEKPGYIHNNLFGSTNAAGRLRVDDVYQSSNQINAAEWIAENKEEMDKSTDHHDHVAIDRFTGGAADTALFNDRTPKRGKDKGWDPITIHVDFSRPKALPKEEMEKLKKDEAPPALTDQEKQQAIALALLVLRDLKAGWVPIGFGSNRGMGDIKVNEIEISGMYEGNLEKVLAEKELQEAWTAFCPAKEK